MIATAFTGLAAAGVQAALLADALVPAGASHEGRGAVYCRTGWLDVCVRKIGAARPPWCGVCLDDARAGGIRRADRRGMAPFYPAGTFRWFYPE